MNQLADLPFSTANDNLLTFFTNLIIAVVLVQLTTAHYRRIAPTTAGKVIIARVLPFVALVTFVVISVVKSSLALSLGMVGALSVIRFRTAIKDPIELGYIFMSVAIGIGMGAGETLKTVIGVVTILVLIAIFNKQLLQPSAKETFLEIDVASDDAEILSSIESILRDFDSDSDIRKIYMDRDRINLIVATNLTSTENVPKLLSSLKSLNPAMEINLIDSSNIPTV